MTFSDVEYGARKRVSRRETFLDMMDGTVPWQTPAALTEPRYYPGVRGRPPAGIEVMLRMYFLPVRYNLADEALEEAVCDSCAMRKFMGLNFLEGNAPDATTLPRFRHLPEEHGPRAKILEAVNRLMEEKGIMTRGGTIIDAAFIEAPGSAKNSGKSRGPETHAAKKGNQWHFGMKAHIGAGAASGMARSVAATAANVADIEKAAELLRKDDRVAYGDSGYRGLEKRPEMREDGRLSGVECRINRKKGADRKREKEVRGDPVGHLEYIGEPNGDHITEGQKSKARSKAEHIFGTVKGLFGFRKARYRGLKKNLANLLKYAWAGCPGWKPAV
jgi:IS5 family transposase